MYISDFFLMHLCMQIKTYSKLGYDNVYYIQMWHLLKLFKFRVVV